MRSLKIIAMFAIIAMTMIVPVFAQMSPTQIATAGVFTTQVEDSMDVHDYGTVEFNKRAGFIGMENDMASLGYAFKPGGIYLGLWYNGNFLSTDSKRTEEVVSVYDIVNQLLSTRLTTTSFETDSIKSNNNIQVLIGVAGMGFKVGLHEELETWSNPDNGEYSVMEYFDGQPKLYEGKIKSFSQAEGVITPSIAWGMTIGKIRPYADIAFGINLNKKTFNTFDDHSLNNEGKIIGDEVITYTGKNEGYLSPNIKIGAEYDISEKSTVGLEVGFGFDIYKNSFSAAGYSGTASGVITDITGTSTIKTTNELTDTDSTATIILEDKSNFTISIKPSFYHETGDGFKLGFYAELPIEIGIESVSDSYTKTRAEKKQVFSYDTFRNNRTVTDTVENPGVTDTISFSIAPYLAVGASYPLISNKLTVNAGIGLSPLKYTRKTINYSKSKGYSVETITKYDADGKVIYKDETHDPDEDTDEVTDRQTKSNTWEKLSIGAYGGFTFNFGANMAVDMAVGGMTDIDSDNFLLDLANVNILFTFKF